MVILDIIIGFIWGTVVGFIWLGTSAFVRYLKKEKYKVSHA